MDLCTKLNYYDDVCVGAVIGKYALSTTIMMSVCL